MKIDVAAYISQLLFEHDCVIIPGFGGFITNYQPASIDYAQGFLHPPTKSITFNQNLTLNDGLLVNYIARKEFIGYEDARSLVEEYTRNCQQKLSRKEILPIPSVGKLYNDIELRLQFLPDATNFRTESFGLPKLHYYPILRAKAVETRPEKNLVSYANPAKVQPDKKIAVLMPKRTTPKILRYAPASAAAVAILLLVGVLAVNLIRQNDLIEGIENIAASKNNSIEAQAGMIPTLEPETSQETFMPPAEQSPQEEEPVAAEESTVPVEELTVDELVEEEIKEEEEENDFKKIEEMPEEQFKAKTANVDEVLNNEDQKTYKISAGSFGDRSNAEKLSTKISADGLDSKIVKRRSTHQVVVTVKCEPAQKSAKLGEIKAKYAKGAFYIRR